MGKIDLARVNSATALNERRLREWLDTAEAVMEDSEQHKRREAQHCRWCWYTRKGGIEGRMFTDRDCESCDQTQTYETTRTNALCLACARRYGICVHCCADLDYADRKVLERSR